MFHFQNSDTKSKCRSHNTHINSRYKMRSASLKNCQDVSFSHRHIHQIKEITPLTKFPRKLPNAKYTTVLLEYFTCIIFYKFVILEILQVFNLTI